jgi:hypothetical protein
VDVLQKLEKNGPPEGSISTGLWHQAKIWTEDASLIVVDEAEFDPCRPNIITQFAIINDNSAPIIN